MSKPQTNTVLVIAGEYPPFKTIGRIRTAKFVEHLRNLSWRPIVLTIKIPENALEYDKSLDSEIPSDVEVFRADWPDWETQFIHKLKQLKTRKNQVNQKSSDQISSTSSIHSQASEKDSKSYLVDKVTQLIKWLFRHWIYIPDNYLPWSKCAYKLANEICDKYKVDLVYTSLPPFSAARIGYKLKKERNVPWVMDYRDLWEGDVLREWINPLRARIELGIERKLVKSANVVISVSEQKTEYLKKLHRSANPKWKTLTNGFDLEMFAPLLAEPKDNNDTIDFVYTGRLFKNRQGYAFAESLGQITQENPSLTKNVRIHMLGWVSPEIQSRYREILKQYSIEHLYKFYGDVSYHQAMRAQVQCDYLLLIVDTGATSDGVIPGKLFEYLASKRPIFALCNPGATQNIIEGAHAGSVVPTESVEEIKVELIKWLIQPIPSKVNFNEKYLSQFDRKTISAKLAEIFSRELTDYR